MNPNPTRTMATRPVPSSSSRPRPARAKPAPRKPRPAEARRRAEKAQRAQFGGLASELIDTLLPHAGEHGRSEGAADCLRRIIAERDALRERNKLRAENAAGADRPAHGDLMVLTGTGAEPLALDGIRDRIHSGNGDLLSLVSRCSQVRDRLGLPLAAPGGPDKLPQPGKESGVVNEIRAALHEQDRLTRRLLEEVRTLETL